MVEEGALGPTPCQATVQTACLRPRLHRALRGWSWNTVRRAGVWLSPPCTSPSTVLAPLVSHFILRWAGDEEGHGAIRISQAPQSWGLAFCETEAKDIRFLPPSQPTDACIHTHAHTPMHTHEHTHTGTHARTHTGGAEPAWAPLTVTR